MFGFIIPFLKPVGMFLAGEVFKRVFKAEAKFGSGRGTSKLAEVINGVAALGDVDIEPGELIRLVNAVVALLNTIGMFDDVPGLDFSSLDQIVENLIEIGSALADLLD